MIVLSLLAVSEWVRNILNRAEALENIIIIIAVFDTLSFNKLALFDIRYA